MNEEILGVKREKRRHERVWRKTHLKVHLEAYKEQRDLLTRKIQKAKVQYEEQRISACGSDQKALFGLTKNLLEGRREPSAPSVLMR
jgi:hypothetical protein